MTEFVLNENEEAKAQEFINKHKLCAKRCPTAIGGHITYKFTPTSIGVGVSICCSLCGKEENITDYSLW